MNLPPHVLSKSSYLIGHQCPKRLWLHTNRPDSISPLSQSQKKILKNGIEVGLLARNLFPNGINAADSDHSQHPNSVSNTFELIGQGIDVIYEASFQYDEVLVRIDILTKMGNKWYGYEVKSSTEIKDYFLVDAALQYYVISNSTLELEDIFIVHINSDYNRTDEIDISQLFTIISVKDQILALQEKIADNIKKYKSVISESNEISIQIGPQCFEPYDCDVSDHCWKHIPKVSIFDLARLRTKKKFELYQKGIIEFNQIPPNFKLTSDQALQVKGFVENYLHTDIPKIKKWLNQLQYPLTFMDFETFMPAVPLYFNSSPYQQIPFQYSLHIQHEPGGRMLDHFEFLGSPEIDPRKEFIESLLSNVPKDGSVVVYNKGFESSRLKELKIIFPKFESEINNLLDRIIDLMEPFQKKWYYAPSMNGSYSIKDVLPALVPELNYKDLEIGEGGSAMAAFEGLLNVQDVEEKRKIRFSLLEYCKLDTFAMKEIISVLYSLLPL